MNTFLAITGAISLIAGLAVNLTRLLQIYLWDLEEFGDELRNDLQNILEGVEQYGYKA